MQKIFITSLITFILGVVSGFALSKLQVKPEEPKPSEPVESLTCTFKGKIYKEGEGFKDDCNSCSCVKGQVACTIIACE